MAQIEVSGFPAPEAEPQYTYISQTLNVRFMEYHIALVRTPSTTHSRRPSNRMCSLVFAQSEATRPAWRRFHQYWALIRDYGSAGHEEVRPYLTFFELCSSRGPRY